MEPPPYLHLHRANHFGGAPVSPGLHGFCCFPHGAGKPPRIEPSFLRPAEHLHLSGHPKDVNLNQVEKLPLLKHSVLRSWSAPPDYLYSVWCLLLVRGWQPLRQKLEIMYPKNSHMKDYNMLYNACLGRLSNIFKHCPCITCPKGPRPSVSRMS